MTSAVLDQESGQLEWVEEYRKVQACPPIDEGTILTTQDGESIRLEVELEEGKPPFIFGRVHVPSKVGSILGWFMQGFNNKETFGLKCILMPKARDSLIAKKGLTAKQIAVKSLKVIRASQTNQSILCEVHEYE